MFGICLGHLVELHPGHFDSLLADAHQTLDHIFDCPLTIFAFAVGLKQRLQPLLHVPLHVVGQDAQKHMAADALVLLVIDRANLQGHRLQSPERLLDQAQAFIGLDHLVLIELLLGHRGADHVAAIKKSLLFNASLLKVPLETAALDFPGHELTHLVTGQNLSYLRRELLGRSLLLAPNDFIQGLLRAIQQALACAGLPSGGLQIATQAVALPGFFRIDHLGDLLLIE